jgi:hypothetical protein
MIMGERGQLKPGEFPTDQQLVEAMKITETTRMLPSQTMDLRKVSTPIDQNGMRYSCRVERVSGIRFIYPPSVVLVDGEEGEKSNKTINVTLVDLAKEVHNKKMDLAKKRLQEIAKLKKENRKGRECAENIIQSNLRISEQLQSLWKKTSGDKKKCIPAIPLMRKEAYAMIERYRELLSDLEYEYNKLLQKEWVILETALQTRRDSIYRLMNNASIRGRLVENTKEARNSK